MNKLKLFFKKRWVYHSAFWFMSMISLYLMEWWQMEYHKVETFTHGRLALLFLISIWPLVVIVYSSIYVRGMFLKKRKYFLFAIGQILIIIGGAALMYVNNKWLEPLAGIQDETLSTPEPFLQYVINTIGLVIIATGIQYFKRAIFYQLQMQELRRKTVQTELNLLKAQLNPHFLFNTLNNIYATNQTDPAAGSEMILELADTLRYHMIHLQSDKIQLEEEMQLLRSYINLEILRLTQECKVWVKIECERPSLLIPPLIFLPFIENAFKHGSHPTRPSFINIHFKNRGKTIYFEVENSITNNEKTVKTHIGLQNTLRRLELLFPDKYLINIDDNGEIYKTTLTINDLKI